MVLHAAGALREEDHVVGFVLNISQPLLPGKGHQVVGNTLGIPGAMGDRADLFKISKYGRGLQTRKLHRFHKLHSFSALQPYGITDLEKNLPKDMDNSSR